jgi:hypothetical protein
MSVNKYQKGDQKLDSCNKQRRDWINIDLERLEMCGRLKIEGNQMTVVFLLQRVTSRNRLKILEDIP